MSSLEPMADAPPRILPFYICLDVSYSMDGPKMAAANEIVPAILDALAVSPTIGDVVRVSVVQFSEESRLVIPLSDPRDILSLPNIEVESGTAFGQLFRLLRSIIFDDFARLSADGLLMHRPVVFLLTDGEPTDDWESEFKQLTDFDRRTGVGFRLYPIIVPFGVDGSDLTILQRIAWPRGRSKVYLASEGTPAGEAIRELAQVMVQSVVSSVAAPGQVASLVLPSVNDIGSSVTINEDWI